MVFPAGHYAKKLSKIARNVLLEPQNSKVLIKSKALTFLISFLNLNIITAVVLRLFSHGTSNQFKTGQSYFLTGGE